MSDYRSNTSQMVKLIEFEQEAIKTFRWFEEPYLVPNRFYCGRKVRQTALTRPIVRVYYQNAIGAIDNWWQYYKGYDDIFRGTKWEGFSFDLTDAISLGQLYEFLTSSRSGNPEVLTAVLHALWLCDQDVYQ